MRQVFITITESMDLDMLLIVACCQQIVQICECQAPVDSQKPSFTAKWVKSVKMGKVGCYCEIFT